MATTNKTGIQASITSGIKSGNSDTTAADLRSILNEVLDSYPNVVDGGAIFQTEVGYDSAITLTDSNSFVYKSWVEDLITSSSTLFGVLTNDPHTGNLAILSNNEFGSLSIDDGGNSMLYANGTYTARVVQSNTRTLIGFNDGIIGGFVNVTGSKTQYNHDALNEFNSPIFYAKSGTGYEFYGDDNTVYITTDQQGNRHVTIDANQNQIKHDVKNVFDSPDNDFYGNVTAIREPDNQGFLVKGVDNNRKVYIGNDSDNSGVVSISKDDGAVTIYFLGQSGTIQSNGFITSGGTSSQFVKGDGSLDSNSYLTVSTASSTYMPKSGGTFTGAITLSGDASSNLQPVTLQQLIAYTNGLYDLRGGYDASTNLFPATGGSGILGAIAKADVFIITVAGTLGGVDVLPGDEITALVDAPGQTSSNWNIVNHELGYTPITNVLTQDYILVGDNTNTAVPIFIGEALSDAIDNSSTATLSGAEFFAVSDGSGFIKKTKINDVRDYNKLYWDSLYQPLDSDLTSWATVNRASGFDTFTATPTSSNLAALITDETGYSSGAFVVFSKSPTIDAPTFSTSITGSYATASTIAEWDSSKNLISATKGTAYNKSFGTGTTNIVEIGSALGNSLLLATDGSGKLQTLATATYPSLTELSYVKGATSALQTQLDNKKFTISFETGAISPADSTTYYFSDVRIVPNTTATNFSFNLGYAYTIIGVKLSVGLNSTTGTTENNTLQIRNITQATSTSVGTFTTDASTTLLKSATFTGLNISVASGDSIACQWDTPAWATNPVGMLIFVTLICKAA